MTPGSLYHIRPPAPDDVPALSKLLGTALHVAPERVQKMIEVVGTQHFRALRQHSQAAPISAGLGLLEMGQWWGGRCVPMVGLSLVGVAPEQRGTGAGTALLRDVLEELHARQVPLSALYPATLAFYQRAGYARAGQRFAYDVPLDGLAAQVPHPEVQMVPLAPEQYAEVYQAYEQRARLTAGNLRRTDWRWKFLLEPEHQPVQRYLLVRAGRTEGYIIYTQDSRDVPLTIQDVCVLTPQAGRRVLAFLAGYRSMVERVTWHGGAFDPLVYLLHEPLVGGARSRVQADKLDWLLRVVDVPGALMARGYPPGLHAELHLDITDPWLPANAGRWVVQVADGQAVVERGGQGRIAVGIGDLATLYSGFVAPTELALLSTLAAPAADLALAGAVFAGARPWMPDMF